MFVSTKTYGAERGYAVAYRQWRADSHCRLIHGYALSFHFEFEADDLDARNWVCDFGGFRTLKETLDDWFDHTCLVAEDDPEFATFEDLHHRHLIKLHLGLIDALEIKDLQVKPARARMAGITVADTSARGIDLRRPVGLASSLDWEPGMPIGRVPVAEGRMSGFGGDLFTRYGLALGSVSTETRRESADLSRSRLRIEDFVLAPSLRSVEALGIRMVLQSMNLKEVRLGFDCSTVEDRAQHALRVEDCKLSSPDLIEISLAARIIDTDDEFWRSIDEADPFGLLGTKAALASGRLVVADKSFLQRSLQAKARLSGQPAAAERAALAAEIRRYQPPGVLITQDMSKLLDAVARFVEQGGTLTVDAAPQPALGLEKLDYLLKPGADLVNALGLTATVSR